MFTVYILRCFDNSYYVGLTRRPAEQRLWEHNNGVIAGYTQSRRPVVLAHAESFDSVFQAISRERQIKGWTRRKKEALIAGRYEELESLSKSRKTDHQ